jgi:hypothetical protein
MSAIQIKQVPAKLHQQLRERAREEGQSLSQYVLSVLERDLATPSMREWLKKVAEDDPIEGISSEEIVGLIHEGRARGSRLDI